MESRANAFGESRSLPGRAVAIRGNSRTSLSEFAEQFESAIREKRELISRLTKALEEKATLTREIEALRMQLTGRSESLVTAKEKLMREEFERKYQELTLEVRRERNKHNELVAELKRQLSHCICRANHSVKVEQ